MNIVTLLGNITKDVNIQQTSGPLVAKTDIAVKNRRNGDTLFIQLVFFSKLAEIAHKYLHKGDRICINGRLEFNQWVTQDGIRQSKHVVIVQDIEMLGKKQNIETDNTNKTNETKDTESTKDTTKPPSLMNPISIDDEEIPF